jgi:Glycoside hydrolase 123 N-terminal domain/Glycoside hydrolase 123, catalytic domain
MRNSTTYLLVFFVACASGGDEGQGEADGAQTWSAGAPDAGDATRRGDAAPPVCSLSGPALANVWAASSLARVGRMDAAANASSFDVSAARGEYESLQVALQAPQGGLSGVSVSASEFVSAAGNVIPASSVRFFREHYVHVDSSSPDWKGTNRPLGPGDYPDGLIPFADPETGADLVGATLDAVPFRAEAGKNEVVWADIFVPPDAPAGDYAGVFTVDSDQGGACVSVALHVWKFALPLKPSMRSSFLVWSSNDRATYAELLRNRLAPAAVGRADERSLIDSLGLATTGLGFFSGAHTGNSTMTAAPPAAQLQAAAATHQKDLFLYDYSADEIGHCTNLHPIVQAWGRSLHAAGVANLVTMAPTPALFDDGSGSGKSAVDVWVVLPVTHDGAGGAVAQALKKGDQVWSYNTLVQDAYSPKWLIDFTPLNFRVQPGFINQVLGLSGLLYWRVDRWSGDAWNNVNNAGTYSSANYPGEAMLVYPGTTVGIAGVAPSMRIKWLRDGVDDYEYIALLKALGHEGEALGIAREVASDWKTWTRDPPALEAARKKLGDLLSSLTP